MRVGGVICYVRRFYELLGNRRRFERVSISGSIFVNCGGHAVDMIHSCSVVNISPGGIAVDCPEPIADAFIQLHSD
jgi:hypothetical protein